MFGHNKKIKQLEAKLMAVEMNYRTYVEVHTQEHRLYCENLKQAIEKKVSETEKKMKQDIDLINFRLDNPNPYSLGEIKSGQHKGWIVIGSEVIEQRGLFTNDLMGYAWETKIVNKKGETKTI